ncbi:MAG: hypothetical protein K5766_03865 [Alphaproteobacteria bacterium]|nr:hypothetical protein [Alphaproteobacteria bacterium]
MKKLLLGAMLAAACITTNVDAGLFKRSKADIEKTDIALKNEVAENYVEISQNAGTCFKNLSEDISNFKKLEVNEEKLKKEFLVKRDKHPEKSNKKKLKEMLTVIKNESETISKFFKSMEEKDRKKTIKNKGKNAKTAADRLFRYLEALTSWKEEDNTIVGQLKPHFEKIADYLKSLLAEKGEVSPADKTSKNPSIRAYIAILSESFESIRGLFAAKQANESNPSVEANVIKQETPTQVEANVVKQETPPPTSPREFTASW